MQPPWLNEVLAEPARLDAVAQVLESVTQARESFDRFAALAATVLDAPVGLVNLVAADRQHLAGVFGLDGVLGPDSPIENARVVDLRFGYCPYALAVGGPMFLDDARPDPVASTRGWCRVDGLLSYAAVPLVDAHGHALGTVCVADHRPRGWSERERASLAALAATVHDEIESTRNRYRRVRLREAFDAAPAGVLVTSGPLHVVEYLNPQVREWFGERGLRIPAAQAFAEPTFERLIPRFDEVYRTGRSYRAEDVRVRGFGPDGSPRELYLTVSYSAIRADGGPPTGLLAVAVDVTVQALARHGLQRESNQQRAVAQATAAMSSSMDPETELSALAASVVPAFADSCSVLVLERPVPVGRELTPPLRTRRIAAVAPDSLPPSLRTSGREIVSWPGDDPVTAAVRSGAMISVPLSVAALPEWTRVVSGSEPSLAAGLAHSVVTAPVVTEGSVVAVVLFAAFANRPRYTGAELRSLAQIAAQASVSVGHGMAYQRTRESALALQRSLLTAPPAVPGMRLAGRYRPAGADTEVGGDWFDAFPLPDGDLAVAVGDVAGHDMAAAATMGQLRSMLRALACTGPASPAGVVAELDRLAVNLRVTGFTSLVYGRIHRRSDDPSGGALLRWCGAGHPPPLVVGSGATQVLQSPPALVLGVDPTRPRPERETVLRDGATLVLYSDGLIERRGRALDVGVEELARRAANAVPGPIEWFCDQLLVGAPLDDDVALLAVRIGDRQG